jgi:inner membrane protein
LDNLCHTLVGAAVGEAGLNRRTRFGNATLMIAANLPDIDVLAFAASEPAVAIRRGWTHGLAAQVVLPIALTAVMLLVARVRPPREGGRPVRAGGLLLLSYVGVLSHVYLDLLNNYGVRLLAPFDWRWFYGDTLFIIDPWLWLVLGLGVRLSMRRGAQSPRKTRPAQVALVAAALYIAAMSVAARVAKEEVLETWRAARSSEPQAAMVGPVAVSPFHRTIIIDAGDHYETGAFAWLSGRAAFDTTIVPKNDSDPRVIQAREAPNIQAFLVWSRFPFWTLDDLPEGTRVSVSDLRFGNRGGAFVQHVIVR